MAKFFYKTINGKKNVMDAATAFPIVLDLARQNLADEKDMPDEHASQLMACDIIEDIAVNDYGDD